jgi:hypothetical protein
MIQLLNATAVYILVNNRSCLYQGRMATARVSIRVLQLLVLSCAILVGHVDAETAAPDSYGLVIPDGYVLQVLDPTDGRIAMPKDWYYTSRGAPNGWVWTFAEEDPRKGEYETGLRIQMFVAVEENTKLSRADFARHFIDRKRKSAKVIKECPIADLGSFERQCIEVLEDIREPSGVKRFHVLYSIMWLKDKDIVAVSTFGAPEAKWDTVSDISTVMSGFVLIGKAFGTKN